MRANAKGYCIANKLGLYCFQSFVQHLPISYTGYTIALMRFLKGELKMQSGFAYVISNYLGFTFTFYMSST